MELKTRKNSNAGMSLLEVIIAVSIFSITAVVLLQSFVTSGRINKKSNLYLEATTIAQNVMEEIKSKNFEDVSLAFNYPIDVLTGQTRLSFLNSQAGNINTGEEGETVVKEVIKDGTDYKDVRLYRESDGTNTSRVTASVISTDDGKTYEFNPRTTGKNESKYYFELTNVAANHENFDVLAEFDGSKDTEYKKKTVTNNEEGKNDYLAPNISKLDTKSNAFLIMGKNWDENAMQQIVNEQYQYAIVRWNEALQAACPDTSDENYQEKYQEFITNHPQPEKLDPDEVYKYIKRTLYVKVSENSGTVKAEAKYTLQAFNYVKPGGSEYERMDICPCHGDVNYVNIGAGACFCTYPSSYTAFYSSEMDTTLKNLYIFYYPNYNSQNSQKPLDEIVFDNTSNYSLQLYVIKQRDEVNDVPSFTQENLYKMSLTVQENPSAAGQSNWNTNPSLYRAKTKLRTNLDFNISNLNDVLNRPKNNQMQLTYQAVNSDGRKEQKRTGTFAKKILSYNGLDDKEQRDRIYTAKISVYKAGAAAKGFPESELVATLDGAKEN